MVAGLSEGSASRVDLSPQTRWLLPYCCPVSPSGKARPRWACPAGAVDQGFRGSGHDIPTREPTTPGARTNDPPLKHQHGQATGTRSGLALLATAGSWSVGGFSPHCLGAPVLVADVIEVLLEELA